MAVRFKREPKRANPQVFATRRSRERYIYTLPTISKGVTTGNEAGSTGHDSYTITVSALCLSLLAGIRPSKTRDGAPPGDAASPCDGAVPAASPSVYEDRDQPGSATGPSTLPYDLDGGDL
ncbi:hypothetical protein TESG_07259 [Trichophyton tonsurans CBS 112818]|uniref:Uncharacterized protein n=1 Tax=Trichophyton tonsurans (strain CBS 112818) TaxID=647933 RepID=F2S8N0_TRIT1|nr:hypothetical protein TESG_07259 [Trichophyton tonsurans CBS 112818]